MRSKVFVIAPHLSTRYRFVQCAKASAARVLLALLLVSLLSAQQAGAFDAPVFRTEHFDVDPGWDEHNNRPTDSRTITQNFGYSPGTSNAGGPSGEVGGQIQPAGETAYYGKVISNLTFNDAFTASGTLNVGPGEVHTQLGFFNADTVNEWRTANTLTLRILGRSDPFFFAYAGYGTQLWRAGENAFVSGSSEFQFADGPGNTYNWSLSYNPAGNGGGGQISATLGGATVTTNLDAGHRSDGGTFNRFGLLDVSKSADSPGTIWIDNVTVNGVTDNFSSNPNWVGVNNNSTYVTTNIRANFDFGYSPTNHAGGQGEGEMGGQLFRGDSRTEFNGSRLAYYGDRLDETLTLHDPLHASGKVGFDRGVSDSTTLIGFFHSTDSIRNSDSQISGIPENFIGAVIEGPSSEGFYFYPAYGVDQEAQASSGRGSPTPPHIYPNGDSHDWSLDYDPTAGAAGRIVVMLDGQAVILDLNALHAQIGAHFDRFGIITTHIDGNGQTVYFDDLTYTVAIVPEPSALALAGLGLVGLLAHRARRRRSS